MARKKQEEQELEVLELEEAAGEVEEEIKEELDPDMYDEEGNELLFPGGPTLNFVEQLKSLHNGEVYLTEFDEEVFLWRPITRKEYKGVMKNKDADPYYKEERLCEAVVLWPEKYNFIAMGNGKAGIPTLLAELVMEKSGFQAKRGAMRL